MRPILLPSAICLLLVVAVSFGISLSAANAIPATRAYEYVVAITPNDLKPPECAALDLEDKITGDGDLHGDADSELIAGGPLAQIIGSSNGTDCVLGGGGDDDIDCGPNSDIAIGGPGTDIFTKCETEIQ